MLPFSHEILIYIYHSVRHEILFKYQSSHLAQKSVSLRFALTHAFYGRYIVDFFSYPLLIIRVVDDSARWNITAISLEQLSILNPKLESLILQFSKVLLIHIRWLG